MARRNAWVLLSAQWQQIDNVLMSNTWTGTVRNIGRPDEIYRDVLAEFRNKLHIPGDSPLTVLCYVVQEFEE